MWNYIFLISGLIAIFGGVIFLIFAQVEPQPWGISKARLTANKLVTLEEKPQPQV